MRQLRLVIGIEKSFLNDFESICSSHVNFALKQLSAAFIPIARVQANSATCLHLISLSPLVCRRRALDLDDGTFLKRLVLMKSQTPIIGSLRFDVDVCLNRHDARPLLTLYFLQFYTLSRSLH